MQTEQHYYENQTINTDPREQRQQSNKVNGPMYRRKKSYAGRLMLTTLLIALLAGGWLFTIGNLSKQQSLSDRTFALTGHSQLTVNDGNGLVSIHAGNTDRITVHSTKFAQGLNASLDDIHTDYIQNGNTISISSYEDNNFLALGSRGVDFDITVPSSIDLTVHTGSGNVHLADIVGQTRASTGSGNIETSNTNGQATFSTGSGNIQVEEARLSGQSSIHTGSGNIHLTSSLDPKGNYRVETGSGNIMISMPAEAAFQLTTKTGSGVLHNNFGNNQVGSSPYAALSIQTGSGNIELDKQ